MNRYLLMENIREMLSKSGFELSDEMLDRVICFDMLARRGDTLLIIKVLLNIDSFNKYSAMELRVVSNFLDGSPLVVGDHGSSGHIEDGAVYLRHGVPIMSPQTIFDYLVDDTPPLVFAGPGGFFVRIDGEMLKEARSKQKLSLGTLADTAGVSRRAIQMYEKGMSASADVAVKLQDAVHEPIIKPCEPLNDEVSEGELFDIREKMCEIKPGGGEVIEHLMILGYEVFPTRKSPFDAITASKKILILTGIENQSKSLKRRARIIHNISQLTDKHSVFFVRNKDYKPNIEGTPAIAVDELRTIDDLNEIIELISERAE
jgi:putative transcriptional regulator